MQAVLEIEFKLAEGTLGNGVGEGEPEDENGWYASRSTLQPSRQFEEEN
jgi:hypothetical protein